MSVVIREENKNDILGRKEIDCFIQSSKGSLSRPEATKLLAQKLKISPDNLFIISLKPGAGTRSVRGLIYIYENKELAKRHIPEHIFVRGSPKEEKKDKKAK